MRLGLLRWNNRHISLLNQISKLSKSLILKINQKLAMLQQEGPGIFIKVLFCNASTPTCSWSLLVECILAEFPNSAENFFIAEIVVMVLLVDPFIFFLDSNFTLAQWPIWTVLVDQWALPSHVEGWLYALSAAEEFDRCNQEKDPPSRRPNRRKTPTHKYSFRLFVAKVCLLAFQHF